MNKIQQAWIVAIMSLLTACSTVKVQENLVTLNPVYFPEIAKAGILDRAERFPNLVSAHQQIHGSTLEDFPYPKKNILPSFMIGDSLVTKIVDAAYNYLVELKESSIQIRKDDIESFVVMFKDNYGASISNDSERTKVNEIIRQYLIVYYSDLENGFIDREGTTYLRPKIKTRIGNDIITAVIAILFEGLFDALFEVPVYKGADGIFLTTDGAEPTAHKLKFASDIPIVSPGEDGIDKYELKAMRYLSGLAADQSKSLSGITIRAFGDLEIGFVVGGHFSFGDNDTFAKILDTIFEVFAKRIVEAASYIGFENIQRDKISAESGTQSAVVISLLTDLKNIEDTESK